MKSAPSFLTHHEIDRLLGGPRTRQRWQAKGRLPDPYELGRVNRTELKLFPSFVLVALTLDPGAIGEATLGALRTETRCSFESESFGELVEPLREAVGTARGEWSFAGVLGELAELAPGPLRAWGETVDRAEHRLGEDCGIAISRRLCEVTATEPDLYVIRFEGSPDEQLPLHRAVAPLEPGECAYVEQTRVLGNSTKFLLPWIAGLSASFGLEEPDDAADEELIDWLRGAIGGRSVPRGGPQETEEEEPDSPQRLPYRRASGPRRRRFGEAGTMTRLHREA